MPLYNAARYNAAVEQLDSKLQGRYTAEQYLEFEMASPVKHELHEGEIVDMSGGTFAHSKITVNFALAIINRLGDSPCSVSSSDMRVRIGKNARGLWRSDL